MADFTGTHKEQVQKLSVKREKLASFIYDMAKIIFSATVILAITALAEDRFSALHLFLLLGGLITTIIFAIIANRVLTY